MKAFRIGGILAACLALAPVYAQEITPLWMQHINRAVNVAATNQMPILGEASWLSHDFAVFRFFATQVFE